MPMLPNITDNHTYIIVRNSNNDPVRTRIEDAHPTELQNSLDKCTRARLQTIIYNLCRQIRQNANARRPLPAMPLQVCIKCKKMANPGVWYSTCNGCDAEYCPRCADIQLSNQVCRSCAQR